MKKIILASILAATTCFTMTTQANAAPNNPHHVEEQQHDKQHELKKKQIELKKKQVQHKAAAKIKPAQPKAAPKKAQPHKVTPKKAAPQPVPHQKKVEPKHDQQPSKPFDERR